MLSRSIEIGHEKTVMTLLNYGPLCHLTKDQSDQLIMLAMQHQDSNTQQRLVRLLIKHGGDYNAKIYFLYAKDLAARIAPYLLGAIAIFAARYAYTHLMKRRWTYQR
ncbi:MAG: hypothetical protein KDK76_06305 [Chlamydiia bacterium]|nr:hypothetical protein [Chlamydiia bacterium]